MSIKTCHILNNFLPTHTAGVEVYVLNLCKKDLANNFVLIIGKENLQYEYDGVKVFVISDDHGYLSNIVKIISTINIVTVHYHLFENGKIYDERTLIEFKKQNIKLVFTFHLVQYYCSTLRLKQNNHRNCKIVANSNSCSQCYFETFYLPKYPKIVRNYSLLKELQIIGKVKNHFINSSQNVNATLDKFYKIAKYFDELITINPDFYEKLKAQAYLQSKLKLVAPDFVLVNKKSTSKKDNIKLIYLGRIESSKGIDRLLDFAMHMNNKEIEIDVYGPIYDENFSVEIFKNISTISMTQLNYKGTLAPNRVLEVLKNYDYLVHPSQIAEMTPLVIKEAFSVGLPVIGNNVFGINTYVVNGINGWLLDFNDMGRCIDFFKDLLSGKKKLGKNIPMDV